MGFGETDHGIWLRECGASGTGLEFRMLLSILNLLLAVLLLELGSALQGVLIPIRGELAGFPTAIIGSLGTVYYIGFVAGCVLLPRTVRRFGHIRSFSALAAIAASTALLHALFVTPWAWLPFRMVIGLCFAGLFMVIESWLNERATPQTRGRILSVYMVATWIGVIGGKMLFSLATADAFDLFALAAIAVALSLVPIALTTGVVPAIPQPSRMTVQALYRIAPVGFLGCIAIGLANGAFWTFAPLFAQARSSSSLGVSLFLSACVLGGALSQWPIGRFSDHIDRRWVIVGVCLTSAAAGTLLAFEAEASDIILLILAGFFGASALSIYSLCVAHANDRADPATFVDVSSHLLLAFGIGAIIGPFLAGLLISQFGIVSLFVFTSGIHSVLALFVLVRIKVVASPPEPERVTFAAQPPISHGTQAVIELQEVAVKDTTEPKTRDSEKAEMVDQPAMNKT